MPIYEYKCDKCGVFELTQRITESALKKCPTCKGKVERIISNTSFVLKGSGWYVTDYARTGNSKSESAGDSAKPAVASSVGSGSNGSTPASKPAENPKPAAEKGASKAAG
jgi:putative FmdB family regulatory protein